MKERYITTKQIRSSMTATVQKAKERWPHEDNVREVERIAVGFSLHSDQERIEKESLFCNEYRYEAVLSPYLYENDDKVFWYYKLWVFPKNSAEHFQYEASLSSQKVYKSDRFDSFKVALEDIIGTINSEVNGKIHEDIMAHKRSKSEGEIIGNSIDSAMSHIATILAKP